MLRYLLRLFLIFICLYSLVMGGYTQTSFSLVSSTPSANATNVAPASLITLHFNTSVTPMGPVIVTLLEAPGGIVAGITSVSGSVNEIITFTPTTTLPNGLISVDYSAIQSTSGLMPFPSSFTFRVGTIDTTRPVLTGSTPLAGSTNVPITTSSISLNFSEVMDTVNSSVTLTSGASTIPLINTSVAGTTLNYTLGLPLLPGTTYTINYQNARDVAGNTVGAVGTFTFTTVPPPALTLSSSVPLNGQQNVSLATSISLLFSNPLKAGSSVAIQGGGENVPLIQNITGSTLTITPQHVLRPSTIYTINMNGLQDNYNQALSGAKTIAFTTDTTNFNVTVTPPRLIIETETTVGITYNCKNQTNSPITLNSDNAVFIVNGVVTATVAAPLSQSIPANSNAPIAATAQISAAILQAAKTANTTDIVLQRTFTEVISGTKVVIVLHLYPGSSLASANSIIAVSINKPLEQSVIGQNEEVYPHAIINGTGNGTVVGTWYVDNSPMDTFQTTMFAGQSLGITMRRSLLTQNLGQHEVQLRLTQPVNYNSKPIRYQVVPANSSGQQVTILGPMQGAVLAPDVVRTAFRWLPIPGAAGYDIAFASSNDALGYTDMRIQNNRLNDKLNWQKDGRNGKGIVLLKHLSADKVIWKPELDEYAQLFADNKATLYWAVRVRFTTDKDGDPSTTSIPQLVHLLPAPASLQLDNPKDNAVIDSCFPKFTWAACLPQSLYKFTIIENDRIVFTAMTTDTHFNLYDYMNFQLRPGGCYSWQVMTLVRGKGMTAVSKQRVFTVKENAVNGKMKRIIDYINEGKFKKLNNIPGFYPIFPIYRMNTASTTDIAEVNNESGTIRFTPVNGAVIDLQQLNISGVFPVLKDQCIQLLLDDIDVTTVAEITESTYKLTPPQSLVAGMHTLTFIAVASDGRILQESSSFTVTNVPESTQLEVIGEPTTDQQRQKLPIAIQVNANWNGDNQNRSDNKILVNSTLSGEPRGNIMPGTYSALNFQLNSSKEQRLQVSSLALEAGAENGRLTGKVGDIGVSEGMFSISGISSRAFSVMSEAGVMKFTATHSIGADLGRKLNSKPPEVLVFTAEPVSLSNGKSLKMVYVDQKQSPQPYDNFTGESNSHVISLIGQAPISKTGFSLQGELAKCDGNQATAFGDITTDGLALTMGVNGQVNVYNCSVNYRQVDANFNSPASILLNNDLAGWDFRVSRPLGQYLNTSLAYSSLVNSSSSLAPSSGIASLAWDISMNLPEIPSINLRMARNTAKSDPAMLNAMATKTRDDNWSISANYPIKIWNFNLCYNHSSLTDFYDVADINTDTPRDRKNGTWSCGVDVQPFSKLRMRADWGLNDAAYAFRNWETNILYDGKDYSRNLRVEAQYTPIQALSLNCSWSRNTSNSAANPGRNGQDNFDAQLNYNLTPKFIGNHNITLSAGWRKSQSLVSSVHGSPGEFTIQLSDMLSFDL